MEIMRESWTDERLDDFRVHVDSRFDAVDKRFEAVDTNIRELRAEMNARFNSLERTLMQLGGGLAIALIGLVGVLIGVIAG
jgi:hypothetical protein